jgi:hypothetical protein
MPGPEDPRPPLNPIEAFVEEKCWLYKPSYAELNIVEKRRIAVIDAINGEDPPRDDIPVDEASELLGEKLIRERGDIQ